jgi:ribosomal-protein-alanine N-acetyltransferase
MTALNPAWQPMADARPPWHRPMVLADLDEVLAVEVQAYSHPWSRRNFVDSLAAGYDAELRLDAAGALLGYRVAMPGFEETHLLNLTVAPAHQRRGHGLALLNRLADLARARNDQRLWLEVRESNATARALYLAQGFVEVALRRSYYPVARDLREDAVVMSLALFNTDGGAHALD